MRTRLSSNWRDRHTGGGEAKAGTVPDSLPPVARKPALTRRSLFGAVFGVLVVSGWQAPAMAESSSIECLADLVVR
jgi:hypothetical protein